MDLLHSKEVEDLHAKLHEQDAQLSKYREQLNHYESTLVQSHILHDVISVYTRCGTFDQAFHQTLEVLSLHLEAQYFAIFWLNDEGNAFLYRHGKGYRFPSDLHIPRDACLMGRCLEENRIIVEPELTGNAQYHSLSQDPPERNLACTPIHLTSKPVGVIRIANLSPEMVPAAKNALEIAGPLLSSTLDRLLYWEENENNKRSIEAMRAIAHSLEHSLDDEEVLQKICAEIPRLLNCAGCIMAAFNAANQIRPVMGWPEGFTLGGEETSPEAYLQQLLESYPQGTCLIEDIHDHAKWFWPQAEIRSIMMAPICTRGKVRAYLVVASSEDEVYGKNHANILHLAATQVSLTLERTAHFRDQEESLRRDPLTKLLNHRVFQEQIRYEVSRCQRYKKPFSVAIADIDQFKQYNEAHGFAAGDDLLKSISSRIQNSLRTIDRTYRYSGDRIAVMLPETDRSGLATVAKRIQNAVAKEKVLGTAPITITVGGVSLKKDEQATAFVDRAEQALNQAKKKGGKGIVLV